MSGDESRRFTDREVALVLRKAAELDERRGADGGTGLSRADLEEIAREVGISSESLHAALGELGRSGRPSSWSLAGAPTSRKAARAVPGELSREALGQLIRIVDERAESAGTVSEALGSVRWTTADRFRSMQVTITPADGETAIHVVEKTSTRLRRVTQLIPGAWGMILGMASVSLPAASGGMEAAGLGLGLAAGLAAGRAAWTWLSRSSAKRVEKLADDLTREARSAAEAGLTASVEDDA